MSSFELQNFYKKKNSNYKLLPFRFINLDQEKVIMTNMVGEFYQVDKKTVKDLINHNIDIEHEDYINLRSKHFLTDEKTSIANELLEIKCKTKYSRLSEFTSLHMFVISLRCEHSCPYCQVSRQSDDKIKYDMSEEVALKSIDLALCSPSKNIKIEFQGGEPLLNFKIIKFIVREVNSRKNDKNIAFVIATNLAMIDGEILNFCKDHDIYISTSLDGPKNIHNSNRPRPGKDSYERTIKGINLCRQQLGYDKVSALMTTTEISLSKAKEIIDEYITRDFDGIFLRPLSPYGFAIKTKKYLSYNAEKWFNFYKEGLEYIIEMNRQGVKFKEFYTSMILKKIFTFQDPGYVDLMSPSGIGIGGIIYNYDGYVFASDESRMLSEMGDNKFMLGHVLENSYKEIFSSDALLDPIEQSFSYSAPMCNDCAFEHYCGADPVYHYATSKDFLGRKPESDFCYRNMSIFKYIFQKMDEDKFIKDMFIDWAQ
ncbi:His-Xaa-Ser system radical SAM maturase HxsB [Gammaproteobacteria bacterium]|jgi:uncharacterized protein|nr:His-Xaa-Ser system radical SAM maturase HxsB [Gammaproteobacteria bacterium]